MALGAVDQEAEIEAGTIDALAAALCAVKGPVADGHRTRDWSLGQLDCSTVSTVSPLAASSQI